jgi:hypothetical protein
MASAVLRPRVQIPAGVTNLSRDPMSLKIVHIGIENGYINLTFLLITFTFSTAFTILLFTRRGQAMESKSHFTGLDVILSRDVFLSHANFPATVFAWLQLRGQSCGVKRKQRFVSRCVCLGTCLHKHGLCNRAKYGSGCK